MQLPGKKIKDYLWPSFAKISARPGYGTATPQERAAWLRDEYTAEVEAFGQSVILDFLEKHFTAATWLAALRRLETRGA